MLDCSGVENSASQIHRDELKGKSSHSTCKPNEKLSPASFTDLPGARIFLPPQKQPVTVKGKGYLSEV